MATAGCRSRISGDLMGWTFSTYDGIAAHGRPSNLRVAMFELIRALDERVVALGGEPWQWWVATDPHFKQNPTFEELEFLKCTGSKTGGPTANANKAYRNMSLIIDRIKGMVNADRFFTTSGGPTAYTVESLEAAIGATLEYPTTLLDPDWWKAVQDALDLLIYARTDLVAVRTHTETYTGFGSTASNAWVNMVGPVVSDEPSGANIGFSWSCNSAVPPFTPAKASVVDGVDGNFAISLYGEGVVSGVFVSGEYSYSLNWFAFSHAPITLSIAGNGGNVDFVVSGTNGYIFSTAPVPPCALGTKLTYSILSDTPTPASLPFNTQFGLVHMNLDGMYIFHDIASVLTDQA